MLTGVNAGERWRRGRCGGRRSAATLPGGFGARERYGAARRVTADSGAASALAGGHPVDGASLLLSALAPANSGEVARMILNTKKSRKALSRCARTRGMRWKKWGGQGVAHRAGIRRGTPAVTENSGVRFAQPGGAERGGGLRLYSHGHGAMNHSLNRAKSGAESSDAFPKGEEQ